MYPLRSTSKLASEKEKKQKQENIYNVMLTKIYENKMPRRLWFNVFLGSYKMQYTCRE